MPGVRPFLSLDQVTIRQVDRVIFPTLSFHMAEGEHWAVTGPSGAGKSVLLQTLLGRFQPLGGHIRYPFHERFIRDHGVADPLFTPRRLMALVEQQAHFRNKQNMTDFYYQQRFHAWDAEEAVRVREQLEAALAALHPALRGPAQRFSMDWVVGQLQLEPLLDKTLIQLSNGETRRLLVALALLRQPLLLLMDNPFTGLDNATRAFFHGLLEQVAGRGTQLLMVTSAREMPDCITHVLALREGRVAGRWPRAAWPGAPATTAWTPDRARLDALAGPPDGDSFAVALRLQEVSVRYGQTLILDRVSWTLRRGEKWALLGPNGAGKSTLLSLVNGDHPQAYANDILLFDRPRGSGESIWDIKRRIGFVSPELHQYFRSDSRCLDVVLSGFTDTLGGGPRKVSREQRTLALAWLALLELGHLAELRFPALPAGQQRLILLLRALVKKPPLLILDEPCQGLDADQAAHFRTVIEQLCAGGESTLIYVSHYADEIPRCVTRVLRLDKGRARIEAFPPRR